MKEEELESNAVILDGLSRCQFKQMAASRRLSMVECVEPQESRPTNAWSARTVAAYRVLR